MLETLGGKGTIGPQSSKDRGGSEFIQTDW